MTAPILTHAEACRLFKYDPATGVLINAISRGAVKAGTESGYEDTRPSGKSYRIVYAHKRPHLAHRIIWLMQTGEWPNGEIDHQDGNGLNNRWLNLCDGTHSKNQRNQKLRRNNTSGHVGVVWHKGANKWRAQIKTDGKCRYLGLFEEINDAIAARVAAQKANNFHPNHGIVRPL